MKKDHCSTSSSYAFRLFAQGLSNRHMVEREPTLRRVNLRLLMEPEWESLVRQMTASVSMQIKNLNSRILQQALHHFYCTIISIRRFNYYGFSHNSYGEKLTRSCLQICRHYIEQGNFDNFQSDKIVKLLIGIYQHYVGQYQITEDNVPQKEYLTKNPAKSRQKKKSDRRKRTARPIESQDSGQQTPFTKTNMKDESNEHMNLFDLELKRRQIQKIKIQQEILMQKVKILDLEKQTLALQQQLRKKSANTSFENKITHESPIQVHQSTSKKKTKRQNISTQARNSVPNSHSIHQVSVSKLTKKTFQDYLKPIDAATSEDEMNLQRLSDQSYNPKGDNHIFSLQAGNKNSNKKGKKDGQLSIVGGSLLLLRNPKEQQHLQNNRYTRQRQGNQIRQEQPLQSSTPPNKCQQRAISLKKDMKSKKKQLIVPKIPNKKWRIYRLCIKEFIHQLKERKLYSLQEIVAIQEHASYLDWNSSRHFMDSLIEVIYDTVPSQITNIQLTDFVNEVRCLKKGIKHPEEKVHNLQTKTQFKSSFGPKLPEMPSIKFQIMEEQIQNRFLTRESRLESKEEASYPDFKNNRLKKCKLSGEQLKKTKINSRKRCINIKSPLPEILSSSCSQDGSLYQQIKVERYQEKEDGPTETSMRGQEGIDHLQNSPQSLRTYSSFKPSIEQTEKMNIQGSLQPFISTAQNGK